MDDIARRVKSLEMEISHMRKAWQESGLKILQLAMKGAINAAVLVELLDRNGIINKEEVDGKIKAEIEKYYQKKEKGDNNETYS